MPQQSVDDWEPYLGPDQHHWECAEHAHHSGDVETYRLRVPGGWLYRFDGKATCFVPLPSPANV